MNNTFNVCDLMRSKDMREFYRNMELSLEEKLVIIRSCYHPLSKQLESVKFLLNENLNGQDKKLIESVITLYELMIQLFYHPEELYPDSDFLYIVQENHGVSSILNTSLISKKFNIYNNGYDAYENINDIIKDQNEQNLILLAKYDVDITLFITENNKIYESSSFKCANIDGEFAPFSYSPYFHDKTLENLDLIETTINYLDPYYRFDTPFTDGDKLKIQLPYMESPIYGILSKKIDQQNYIYQFLYDIYNKGIGIDISYIDVGNTNYSKFDWIERL